MTTPALTRQQLCAALTISESTVRRLELDGMPYTPIGVRGKRYDLDECKRWLMSVNGCKSAVFYTEITQGNLTGRCAALLFG